MEDKQLIEIPIERIDVETQVRETFQDETIFGLAQSLKDGGLRQPIVVRPRGERFIVLTGERRLRAAKLAGLASVTAIVDLRKYDAADVLIGQLIENVQRDDLLPLEKARALDQLIRTTNSTGAEVAVKLGLSPATVSKLLSLLKLPEDIQKQIADGRISASTAYELAKVGDDETQAELAAQAAGGKLRRDDVKRKKVRRSSKTKGIRSRARWIQIPMGGGQAVAMAKPDMTVQAFAEFLQQLLNRIRVIERQDLTLPDAVTALAAGQ